MSDVGASMVNMGLSNSIDDRLNWGDGIGISTYRLSGPLDRLSLFEVGGSSLGIVFNLSLNTTYYLTLIRSGADFTLNIYSDSLRTNLLATRTVPVASTTYRYLYVVCATNGGFPALTVSGYTEDVKDKT